MQKISDNIYLLIILGMFGAALLVISFILINIRNRNKLLRQQRKAQEAVLQHQKDLLHAVINSQEEERKRIGSDLHDDVGSALSTLRLHIQKITDEIDPAKTMEIGNQSKTMIDKIITNTRNISHDLSPIALGPHGLIDALEDYCDEINHVGKPGITLDYENEAVLDHLPLNKALALYRVIRELIKNTITHASASTITVSINKTVSQLQVIYKDDGRGMNAAGEQMGMGMNNIESRLGLIGANYRINTAPGKGFEIRIEVPVN